MASINQEIAKGIIEADSGITPEQEKKRSKDLEKYLDLDGLYELAKSPSVEIYESTFKKYVIPFYIEQSEKSRLNLIELLKGNLRCEIIVLDDKTKEVLFKMPPPFSEFQYLTPINNSKENHILVRVFDEFFSKIDNSTPIAVSNMATAIANTPVSIDVSDDLKILIILIKYGHIPTKLYEHFKSKKAVSENPINITEDDQPKEKKEGEIGYDWD